MTLEELKTIKERADNLAKTFRRDREILQEEKKRLAGEVNDSLDKLLQEVKDYTNLISLAKDEGIGFTKVLSDGTNCQFIHCSYYTRFLLTKKEYGTLAITYIDGAWVGKVSERLFRLGRDSLEDILLPIFLQNKDSILSCICYCCNFNLEISIGREKNKNDKLYENIIRAKAVIK